MDKVCRVCREIGDNLVDIFDNKMQQADEPSLADMLSECTSCVISNNDALPQQLCMSCMVAVRNFFEFKRKCEESQQYFMEQLGTSQLLEADNLNLTEWATDMISVKLEQEQSVEELTATCSENQAVCQLQMDKFIECDVICETNSNIFPAEQPLPHPNTKKASHSCTTCGKEFLSKKKLNLHERFHARKRQHKCQICSKQFVNPGNLADHIRAHTGERPYKCPHCVKAFTQRGRLNEHIRTHTGERPFKCMECLKTFTNAGNLTVHKRIHTGMRPYKCNQCQASYVQPGALQRHRRVHLTDERPFKCVICLMPFPKSSYLKRHMNSHTDVPNLLKDTENDIKYLLNM